MKDFLISIPLFLFAIIIHEVSHGWVANKLGDPTAKYSGRLTINPLVHIDPFGTILLPILLLYLKSPVIFGWAKPVPINFWNLRKPKRDIILVGLAGPLANFLAAIVLSLFLKFNLSAPLIVILNNIILLNLVLGVFNLIPIPPLDGSRVVFGLLPGKLSMIYAQLESFGTLIIFLLLFLGVIDIILFPAVIYLSRLLGVNF